MNELKTLKELVEKWRKYVKGCENAADNGIGQEWGLVGATRQCADELETALAAEQPKLSEEQVRKATPRPWRLATPDELNEWWGKGDKEGCVIIGPNSKEGIGLLVCSTNDGGLPTVRNAADAKLIILAVNALLAVERKVDLEQVARDIVVTYDLHCEAIDDPGLNWLADYIVTAIGLWLPAHDAKIIERTHQGTGAMIAAEIKDGSESCVPRVTEALAIHDGKVRKDVLEEAAKHRICHTSITIHCECGFPLPIATFVEAWRKHIRALASQPGPSGGGK